jgi:glycosyltransferase involved in cell wall biosynthesis
MNWQQQAQTLVSVNRYDEAANIYEQAIEAEPEVVTHYWHLGLVYLLLGQEEQAQATWLFPMSQGTTEEIEKWTMELVQILDNEAQRQADLLNLQTSLLIRQYIREIAPKFVNNLLQIIQLSIALDNFTPEVIQDLQVVELLKKNSPSTVDPALLSQFTASVFELYHKSEQNYQQSLKTLSFVETLFEQHQKTIQLLSPETPISNYPLYYRWLINNYPKKADLQKMAATVETLLYKPLVSVVMPVYNTPERFLREAIESMLEQVYPNWELCIADDASNDPHIQQVLQEYLSKDSRIKVAFRKENGHISLCSNSAIEIATGEFIALLDHDDLLTPDALYEVVLLLNRYPDADMIYSDEDKLSEDGKLVEPFFKPDWCPDSFLSRMYTCHLGVYRHSLINQIGGFRVGYEGSQDYDLVLRLTEKTEKIYHIPKVLYHWRLHSGSASSSVTAKPYAYQAAQRALTDAIDRRDVKGRVLEIPDFPGCYTIRYEILNYKLVSIIIPTKNLGSLLDKCLKSIFNKSLYPNYEVIVIDNGSTEIDTVEIINTWKNKEPKRFKSYHLDIPFNYSIINNFAALKAQGEFLLFLHSDTEVITPDWIDAMVEQAQRDSIGAVGALLLYPNNSIQHSGVVIGLCGIAGHTHRYFPSYTISHFGQVKTINNFSALSGACLMCRREVFELVGRFNEDITSIYSDIDLCLEIFKKGYRNIYVPHVSLYHHESRSWQQADASKNQIHFLKEIEYLQTKWKDFINHDPCYSPNLTRELEDYSINA